MKKMKKPLCNSPFYAMKFGHRITYVVCGTFLGPFNILFTKLLEAHTKLLETHTRLFCNSNSTQFHCDSDKI